MRTGRHPTGHGVGRPGGERCGEASGEVFDALWARDQIRIYACEAERTPALADLATATLQPTARAVPVGW